MNNLVTLQEQLNSDPELRSQFMKDPASFLKAAGLQILPEQAQKLTENINLFAARPLPDRNVGLILIGINGR